MPLMLEHRIPEATRVPETKPAQVVHTATFRNAPLLKLPPELRNAIYGIILENTPSPRFRYTVSRVTPEFRRIRLTGPSRPTVAQTCRMLRIEVLAMYYGMRKVTVDMRERLDPDSTFTYNSILLSHPAWQYVRAVDFVFSVMVAPRLPKRHGSKASIRMTHAEARFKLSMCDRCCCEVDAFAQSFRNTGESRDEVLRRFVGWVEDTVIPDAGKYLEKWVYCERCTKIKALPEPATQGLRVAEAKTAPKRSMGWFSTVLTYLRNGHFWQE